VLHERKSRLADGRANMSSFAVDEGPLAAAPRVGADLSAARERLGWSLEDVAASLRIRLHFLNALERGRVADLPGNTYALGFLRTYAAALGLDPDELTRRFRAEAAEVNRLTTLSFPVPVPSRGVPAGAVVLLGVVLAIGAYIGWYRLSGNGELPPEVVPPVPARLLPLAERAVPPVALPPPQSAQPAPGPSAATAIAHVSPAPTRTDTPEPTPSVAPTQAAAATTMVAPTQPAPAQPTTLQPTTLQPTPGQPRIVLSATADAWLLVRDKAGPVLLNRVLHPGESWPVPAQPNLLLTTGNAGGTDILVDGAATPSLGISGGVRRDIPLDPDLLKAGKPPSAASPITTAGSAPPVGQSGERR